jgi:hypothetical protein
MATKATPADRLKALDWAAIEAQLDDRGYALTGRLLGAADCRALAGAYDDDGLYRSHIVMQRHGFGQGEYRYFAYPLPPLVAALRTAAYPPLAAIANRWMERLGSPTRYPKTHAGFLKVCHAAGQTRPTPLLLRYGKGDFNHLHQDLYGDIHFPLQLAILLNAPGDDFDGGVFALTEQRPRMQSRVEVAPLARGEGVIFPVNERPVDGRRGVYRAKMRHGVSRIRRGRRHTLGVIFHDAA